MSLVIKVVEYKMHFPAIVDFFSFIPGIEKPFYESTTFDPINQTDIEADFRYLDKKFEEQRQNNNNFVIMPFYPYHPHEALKDELDEEYIDNNNNNQYDKGESFVDENNDGKWNENNPPTRPTGFGGRHLLGTDNTGRDIFARVIDGFKVSITFAVICTLLSYTIGICIGAILGY